MLVAYFKLVLLNDELRAKHKIKIGASIPRFDCIKYAGVYNGFDFFINEKGMLFFSYVEQEHFSKAHPSRQTNFSFTKSVKSKTYNITGLYTDETGFFAYGYPYQQPFYKGEIANPVFKFKSDLYLFVISDDYKQIEIFVIPNNRGFADDYLQSLINGELETDMERLRKEAKTFFNY